MITSAEMSAEATAAGIYGIPDSAANVPGEVPLFLEFLSKHVRRNQIMNVQRMLLWSEWVRFHIEQTHSFPNSICEQEFDDIMTQKLHIRVIDENFFGTMYDGIQFIPGNTARKI